MPFMLVVVRMEPMARMSRVFGMSNMTGMS